MIPKSVDALVGFYLILLLFGSSLLLLSLHVVSFLAMAVVVSMEYLLIQSPRVASAKKSRTRRIDLS
jgi:hypothetical protein